jgi:phospholipid transport system substrate-binding protein
MHHTVIMVLVALATAIAPALAAPPSPLRQLQERSDRVIAVLEDPALKAPARVQDRREAVRKIAIEMFDAEEAARRALALHWKSLTAEQRRQFTGLFVGLLEKSYSSKVDLYGGQRVRYVSEAVDGELAVVKALVTITRGDVPVEARLNLRGDRWLVYDIVVENVSLIGNYRSQFDRIIRTSSYQELVRRLESNRDLQ